MASGGTLIFMKLWVKSTLNSLARVAVLAALGLFAAAAPAQAVPVLQLYIEGSTYDATDETWTIQTTGTFTLWVIGDVSRYGTIYDVRLSAAAATSEIQAGGTVSLTPTTATGITDPSTASTPVATVNSPSPDGAIPLLGNGSPLPSHGEFGPGVSFFEWSLGDFTLTDSPIGDFITTFPSSFPDMGQISAYTVTVSGLTEVHFDAYDHIESRNKLKFVKAPFSHDASGTNVPEPGVLFLLGGSLAGLAVWARRRS